MRVRVLPMEKKLIAVAMPIIPKIVRAFQPGRLVSGSVLMRGTSFFGVVMIGLRGRRRGVGRLHGAPPLGRENFGGSMRVAKISRSHRPALAPPGVARRSPPTRIGRPEVKNKSMLFTEPSAEEFMSGDTEGGRPPIRWIQIVSLTTLPRLPLRGRNLGSSCLLTTPKSGIPSQGQGMR